jgi:hypothetical protein
VTGCERRPVSASLMSRPSFASLPVCVYKFSSHYLNNIIFYRQQFGASSERITLYNELFSSIFIWCPETIEQPVNKYALIITPKQNKETRNVGMWLDVYQV